MTSILEVLYGEDTARVQKAFETEDAKILTDLAEDKILAVRLEVAGNENTPTPSLHKLSKDKDSGVRLQVAGNINADKAIITLLLQDENVSVREEASYSEHVEA